MGHSEMNNCNQIQDCLDCGWIVLSVEYHLCPGVDVLEGAMTGVHDVLVRAQGGGLAGALKNASLDINPDPKRVMAMGTSAGGHLTLLLVNCLQPQYLWSISTRR